MSNGGSASAISGYIKTFISDWNLSTSKMSFFVTDNCRSMVAACRYFPNAYHIGCIVHKIQLAVEDSLKRLTAVVDILYKCRKIGEHIKKSNVALQLFLKAQTEGSLSTRQQSIKLIQSCPTRWNSTFFMISRLVSLYDAVEYAVRQTMKPKKMIEFTLDNSELSLLNGIIFVLGPACMATEDLSVSLSNEPSQLSSSQAILRLLISETWSAKQKLEGTVAGKLGANIFRELNKRFPQNIPEYFTAALALDPRVGISQDELEKERTKQLLRDMWKKFDKSSLLFNNHNILVVDDLYDNVRYGEQAEEIRIHNLFRNSYLFLLPIELDDPFEMNIHSNYDDNFESVEHKENSRKRARENIIDDDDDDDLDGTIDQSRIHLDNNCNIIDSNTFVPQLSKEVPSTQAQVQTRISLMNLIIHTEVELHRVSVILLEKFLYQDQKMILNLN